MPFTSSCLDSTYSLGLTHGEKYWDVKDGRWVDGVCGHMWAIGKKHHPDKPIPSAIYAALRAAPTHTLTLAQIIALHALDGLEINTILGYLREMHKQDIIEMVSKGTA